MANKSYQKQCKKCKSSEIKKDGFKRGKQRYKCKCCGYVFQNKTRSKNVEIKQIWNDYCFGKQTYSQLSEKYGETIKTIQKKLDEYEFVSPIIKPREIIFLMDTTYCQALIFLDTQEYTKIVKCYKEKFRLANWTGDIFNFVGILKLL